LDAGSCSKLHFSVRLAGTKPISSVFFLFLLKRERQTSFDLGLRRSEQCLRLWDAVEL